MANIHIERIMTTITRPHEVKLGNRQITVSPGTNNMSFNVDTNDSVSAKLANEYDWFNYGKVGDYVHKTGLGYELWLFTKNNSPINFTADQSASNKKTKKSWW